MTGSGIGPPPHKGATAGDALEWHRRHYGVPAREGMRVVFNGKPGEIIGASEQYLVVRLDEDGFKALCHPTWHVDYGNGRDYGAEHDERVAAFVESLNQTEPDRAESINESSLGDES